MADNAGISFALCKKLAQDGHTVFLGAGSASKGKSAVNDIFSLYPKAEIVFFTWDITSEESIEAAARTVKESIDPHKLYAVVYNAGGLNRGKSGANSYVTFTLLKLSEAEENNKFYDRTIDGEFNFTSILESLRLTMLQVMF